MALKFCRKFNFLIGGKSKSIKGKSVKVRGKSINFSIPKMLKLMLITTSFPGQILE